MNKSYNVNALNRFDQSDNASINRLFWIAASSDSYDLKSFLCDDIEDDSMKELFSDIKHYRSFKDALENRDEDNFVGMLIENNKCGLIAEVYVKQPTNICYEANTQRVESYHTGGVSQICYVYAETLPGLLVSIEKKAKIIFDQYIAKDRQKKKMRPTKKKS